MPIYTRTGDKGETSLFNKERVSKANVRVEAYGTIDELNSAIGVVQSQISNVKSQNQISKLKTELIKIQNDLLRIGSTLANPQGLALWNFSTRIKEFEGFIDEMTEHLPPLKNFILPGGGRTGAMLHLARTICRRSERRIVALNNPSAGSLRLRSGQAGQADKNIIIYFNRLSDLLFTMARFVNFKEKKKEIIWIKK